MACPGLATAAGLLAPSLLRPYVTTVMPASAATAASSAPSGSGSSAWGTRDVREGQWVNRHAWVAEEAVAAMEAGMAVVTYSRNNDGAERPTPVATPRYLAIKLAPAPTRGLAHTPLPPHRTTSLTPFPPFCVPAPVPAPRARRLAPALCTPRSWPACDVHGALHTLRPRWCPAQAWGGVTRSTWRVRACPWGEGLGGLTDEGWWQRCTANAAGSAYVWCIRGRGCVLCPPVR